MFLTFSDQSFLFLPYLIRNFRARQAKSQASLRVANHPPHPRNEVRYRIPAGVFTLTAIPDGTQILPASVWIM